MEDDDKKTETDTPDTEKKADGGPAKPVVLETPAEPPQPKTEAEPEPKTAPKPRRSLLARVLGLD